MLSHYLITSSQTPPARTRLVAVALLLFWRAGLAAAAAETGTPFITNYYPQDYTQHSQNWSVVQDGRGVLYFGNGNGVLQFDGVSWRLFPVTNGSIVRSLALDASGRLYVGAVGELGYLQADDTGTPAYVSLTGELDAADRSFSDVWRTFATAEGIFFWTNEKLMRWRDGAFRSWPTDSHRAPALVDGRIFHNQRGVGLTVFTGDGFELLPGGELLIDVKIMWMLPFGKEAMLVGSRDGRLRAVDLSSRPLRLRGLATEADAYLARHQLYSAALLPGGDVALATFTGGIVVIDREGRLLHRLTREQGLADESVWALCVDREGGLWAALNRGISRIEIGSPWTAFTETEGLEGTVESLTLYRGVLHMATSLGLFRLAGGRIEEVSRRGAPFWSLLAVEGGGGGRQDLLAGAIGGVYDVTGGKLRQIASTSNAFELVASEHRPGTVWVGHIGGIGVLRFADGAWVDAGSLPGVDKEVRSIAEDGQGRLWMGTHFDGVLRLTFAPGAGLEVTAVDHFHQEHGLTSTKSVKVQILDGELLLATAEGLLRFDPATDTFAPHALFGPALQGGAYGILRLSPDEDAHVWMSLYPSNTMVAFRQADGTYALDRHRLRRITDRSIHAILPDAGGAVWFGGVEGLYRFDAAGRTPAPAPGVPPSAAPFAALIRRVSVAAPGGTVLYGGAPVAGATPPVLPYASSSVRFEYALPRFDEARKNVYRSRLVGLDDIWSEWTGETYRDFTALREGRYRFEVQGRDLYQRDSEVAAFALRVLPPWYRTWWAYGLYALAFSGGALGVHRWQLKRARLRMELERLAEANALMRSTDRERQRFVRDLEAKNAEMERFIYSVSHDLKSPLISIRGFLGMLEKDMTQGNHDRMRHDMERIHAATGKMGQLVQDLLELSRIGRVANEPREVDLAELAREALEPLSGPLAKRAVEVAIHPDLPAAAGDRQRLRAMLQNLIENAVKYMGEQARPRIEIGFRREEGETVYEVRDNGAGIEPRYQEQIFGLFERLDTATEGTGIGLALVRRIVEVHGGRVWVESEGAGRGSTFCFTLAALAAARASSPS